MSEQTPTPTPPPDYDNRRALRQQLRAARREAFGGSSSAAIVVGVVLLLIGAVYLLQNTGAVNFAPANWWALFILIPAVASFESARRLSQSGEKRLARAARSSLMVGGILTLVAAAFLLDMNWTFVGPILIILAGLGLIANYLLPVKE